MHRERLEKAKNLKLAITAGIGSDHVDLHAAAEHGLTVAEATGDSCPDCPVTSSLAMSCHEMTGWMNGRIDACTTLGCLT